MKRKYFFFYGFAAGVFLLFGGQSFVWGQQEQNEQRAPTAPKETRSIPRKLSLTDSTHYWRITLDVSGGVSGSARPAEQRALPGEQYRKGGLEATAALRFAANDVFSIGFETGLLTLSRSFYKNVVTRFSDGTRDSTDITATLYAVPMLLQGELQRWGFRLSAGFGFYYLYSEDFLYGAKVSSGGLNMGYSLGLGYSLSLSKNFSVGPQVELHYIPDEPKYAALAQLRFSYVFRFE